MNAITVKTYGGPDGLAPIDVEPEPLGPDDVRIRVAAAAVSPTDTVLRAGGRAEARSTPPADGLIPGMDVAGEVAEIGAEVGTGINVGDRVMGVVVPTGAHGAYRSDLVLPAASVVRSPANVTDAEASTIPMNGLTAVMAFETLALQPGDTVAITGAAGTFGGYAVELAKDLGLTVVADAAESDEELVKRLGADVIVPRGDDVADHIRQQVPDGVDGLIDGSVQGEHLLRAVKDGGRMATVRGYKAKEQDRITVKPVWVFQGAFDHWAQLDRLRQMVEEGSLTPRVADVVPADQAPEAHRRLEAGGLRGRIVLHF